MGGSAVPGHTWAQVSEGAPVPDRGDLIEKGWRPEFRARHRAHAEAFQDRQAELEELIGRPLHRYFAPVPVPDDLASKSGYKELQAIRSPLWQKDVDKIVEYLEGICPGYWIHGHDDAGHRYAKTLYCGREWCSVCGEKNSPMHLRRFFRLLQTKNGKPRATLMKTMGYFVIEWPLASRHKLRTKKGLSEAGKIIRAFFKQKGYARGLSRWHWAGDKEKKWNPHLNVLVDGAYIPESRLEGLKTAIRAALGEQNLIVNYSYRRSPGEMVHTLKYVTRATFRDPRWDIGMALELRGFRNQSWWGSGQWNGEIAWSLDDLSGEAKKELEGMDIEAVTALNEGKSPYTGGRVYWGPVLPINILLGGEIVIDTGVERVRLKMPGMKRRALGAGYYELEKVDQLLQNVAQAEPSQKAAK